MLSLWAPAQLDNGEAYLNGYRGVLGMGYLELVAV